METLRVGGRKYSDPDIISLVRATGQLVDPRSAVVNQARQLYKRYRDWNGKLIASLDRMRILASLQRLDVEEMTISRRTSEDRDAVLIPSVDGRRGRILYNPKRPIARVAFSIAHEISHTFFPNSMSGARFRSVCESSSREANELESLCDLGASELLLPMEEFTELLGKDWGLHRIDEVMNLFGSSFEASVFRLATAYPRFAAAGLLRYRLRKNEELAQTPLAQSRLFGNRVGVGSPTLPARKYRRQSFFMSEACRDEHIVRWNKSFDRESVVYKAGLSSGVIHRSREVLPNKTRLKGTLEAVAAPYQRNEADAEYRDVLFFWFQEASF